MKAAQESRRHCCRCGKPLDDPASKDRGIGPKCRGMDNRLLAQQIEADPSQARRIWTEKRRKFGAVPTEAMDALAQVEAAVLGMDRSFDKPRKDWRDVMRNCEYLLSWGGASGVLQETIYAIAESLGYATLVACWRGDIVKGESFLELNTKDGYILLVGPKARSKTVYEEMRQHGYFDGSGPKDRRGWKFPLTEHAWVQSFVRRTYVRIDPNYEKICREAADYLKHNPEACQKQPKPRAKAKEKAKTTASIEVLDVENRLIVRSPYNREFLAAFKEMFEDWRDRRWDKQKKVWIVYNAGYLEKIRTLADQHYDQVLIAR